MTTRRQKAEGRALCNALAANATPKTSKADRERRLGELIGVGTAPKAAPPIFKMVGGEAGDGGPVHDANGDVRTAPDHVHFFEPVSFKIVKTEREVVAGRRPCACGATAPPEDSKDAILKDALTQVRVLTIACGDRIAAEEEEHGEASCDPDLACDHGESITHYRLILADAKKVLDRAALLGVK